MNKRRVCIIGNSHAAALRAGLDIAPNLSERFTFDFFAAQSDLMREMVLQGTKLVPTSELTKRRMGMVSGGKAVIETSDYESFVLVGLGFNIVKIMEALQKYRLHGFNDSDSGSAPYVSRACLSALVESTLRGTTLLHFARLLRSTSMARIIVIPQPYPSEDILKVAPYWKQAMTNGLLAYVAQKYEDTATRLVADAGCEYLPQPAETWLPGPFTQTRFSHGSIRLASDMNHKHPPAEPFHMNALFGAEVLTSCEGLLQR